MDTMTPFPTTLIEAVTYFADEDRAVQYAAEQRWPEGVTCQHCTSKHVGFVRTRRLWQCKNKDCGKQFTVKTGSIMEDSPIPVSKWLVVMWLAANAKNSISSYEVHRAIGVTQKSAWFMMHRVHLAMHDGDGTKFKGEVECDETYVGGKIKNMHHDKRPKGNNKGSAGKTIVMGILERKGRVRAKVIKDSRKMTMQALVREHVEIGSDLFTDAHMSYRGLETEYVHAFVDHTVSYAEGKVHTNGLENFWSLFKRCIKGTHVSVEPFHLERYVDGEAFRYNNRKTNDAMRLKLVASNTAGKRLTYKQLIGDAPESPPQNP